MSRIWITGYRNYELGIFSDHDPKEEVIKIAIKQHLVEAIQKGCQWIISGGQLGVEQWTMEVAEQLKKEFPGEFKTSVILPFEEFGKQWNENNQLKLSQIINSVDFSANLYRGGYKSPIQFQQYQKFMLDHTDEALLIYDVDNPGKTKYDYNIIKKFSDNHDYQFSLVNFDDLQEVATEYESNNKKFD